MQVNQKVFCIETRREIKIGNISPIIAHDQVIRKVNDYCKKLEIEQYGKKTIVYQHK